MVDHGKSDEAGDSGKRGGSSGTIDLGVCLDVTKLPYCFCFQWLHFQHTMMVECDAMDFLFCSRMGMLASCCHAMIPNCVMTTTQTHSVPGIVTKDQCLGLL